MRKPGLYFTAACIALSAVFALVRLTPNSPVKADEGSSIVGTWINSVAVNTPSGSQPLTTELVSFNPGGTFIDTLAITHSSENPFLPPPVAVDSSDAFGSWRQLDDPDQFAATFKRLLFAGINTPTALYGPFFPGQHVGFETVQAIFSLHASADGDTLAGPFTVQFANLGGQVVFAGSGTVSATRLKIEPLMTP